MSENEKKEQAKIWEKELEGIEKKYIDQALEDCTSKYQWPPTLDQFKKLCLSYQGSSRFQWSDEVVKKTSNKSKNETPVGITIDEGAKVCKKLKKIYPEKNWWQIASVFTNLKMKTRTYYPGMEEVGFLQELNKYSKEDLMESLGLI